MTNVSHLAESWVRLQTTEATATYRDELLRAADEIWELGHQAPMSCLDVIRRIASSTDDEFILSNLGAGPLEDLMVAHGTEVIDEVERLTSINNSFRMAVTCIWRQDMSDALWTRLSKLQLFYSSQPPKS